MQSAGRRQKKKSRRGADIFSCAYETATLIFRAAVSLRLHKPIFFCELPEIVVEKLIVWDDYESEYTTFDVCGTEIRVLDEELAEALKQLPEQSRNIVLMFFFLDMSDSEIGEKLNINRSTSYRHRRNSLEEIRKQLKEKKTNEE